MLNLDAGRHPAAKYAYAVIDLVSRKWIAAILVAEPNGIAVRVLFTEALAAEGLLSDELACRLADLDDQAISDDDPDLPLLLAISDNGTEMRCRETRKFMAVCSIVQHFGRPSTPTDQAWIETLWGHVKAEHPHLLAITDPAVLAAELERIRVHYNREENRLHEAIGYVTPDDEPRWPRRRHPQSQNRRARRRRRTPPGMSPNCPWARPRPWTDLGCIR